MTTSTQIIITILSSSGLLSFLGFLFKRKITLEIENSIKTKYDLKLETLKNDLNISHSILTNSLITQNEGLKVTHAKRLEAIEKYWIMIIISEELINSIRLLDSILTIEEFEKIDKKTLHWEKHFSPQ